MRKEVENLKWLNKFKSSSPSIVRITQPLRLSSEGMPQAMLDFLKTAMKSGILLKNTQWHKWHEGNFRSGELSLELKTEVSFKVSIHKIVFEGEKRKTDFSK